MELVLLGGLWKSVEPLTGTSQVLPWKKALPLQLCRQITSRITSMTSHRKRLVCPWIEKHGVLYKWKNPSQFAGMSAFGSLDSQLCPQLYERHQLGSRISPTHTKTYVPWTCLAFVFQSPRSAVIGEKFLPWAILLEGFPQEIGKFFCTHIECHPGWHCMKRYFM